MGRTRAVFLSILMTLAAFAGACATASAATQITASSITYPANGSERFYNGDNGTGSVTVRGTVTGAAPGTLADLRCYSPGVFPPPLLAMDIDVSSGSFALQASLSPIAGQACTLRLVPDETLPTGVSAGAFGGPEVSVSDLYSHSATGNLYGYYILAGPLQWSFAFQSLGECPVTASYVTDPTTLASLQLFAGDACLPEESGIAPDLNSRSSLEVDGLNAYVPAAVGPPPGQSTAGLTGDAGFLPITYRPKFNHSHDSVTINETDTAMICGPPGTFPPTPGTCPSLHDSGIRISQTSMLAFGGQVARVSQRFENVGPRTHTIDVLFNQSAIAPGAGELPGFEFPGQQTIAAHAAPDSFTEFGHGAESIIVIGNSATPPSNINPIGAITFYRAPHSADFVNGSGSQTATFTMHYNATLRAHHSITFNWSFAQATSAAALGVLEAVERDRFVRPSISISSPRKGFVSRRPEVRVSGHVSDRVGVRSVTVDGRRARIAARGRYAVTIRLAPGRERITAIATNYAGNTRTTSVTVTYARR
jgi:hypothetical protein